MSFTVNGQSLPQVSGDNISKVTDKYSHGNQGVSRREFEGGGGTLTVGLTFKSGSSVSLAALNYIAINYPRELRLPGDKHLVFYLTASQRQVSLRGAGEQTRVWDVTDTRNVGRVEVGLSGNEAVWRSTVAGARTYAAWEPGGKLPSPVFVESVRNQNLHSLATADMVIFTMNEWKSQAERVAEFHRNDAVAPLEVVVLTPQEVTMSFLPGLQMRNLSESCLR